MPSPLKLLFSRTRGDSRPGEVLIGEKKRGKIRSMVAMENHAVGMPWWQDYDDGVWCDNCVSYE